MCRRNEEGFALIELMIVIAIIAILAAIALPAYQDYVIRAQVSEGFELSGGARAAIWDFISNRGTMPANNSSAGLPNASSIVGKYVKSVDVTGGLITVTWGANANKNIENATVALSPIRQEGALSWVCKPDATVKPRYLPTSCR